ncbi:hypothetical protein [Glycomyces paridis]
MPCRGARFRGALFQAVPCRGARFRGALPGRWRARAVRR